MALGAAWAILQPVMTMIVFSVFFGRLAKVPSDGIPYPVFAYAALLPWQWVRVSGPSMVPTLRDGDRVVVRHGAPIRPGDVVLASYPTMPGRLVLKRAVRRSPLGLRATGALILASTCLHVAWLIAPAYERQGLLLGFAGLALCAMALASSLIGRSLQHWSDAYAG